MPNLSRDGCCCEPDCWKPIYAKKMCRTHYGRWYRTQHPTGRVKYQRQVESLRKGVRRTRVEIAELQKQTKVCEGCGATIKRSTSWSAGQWERKRCCSVACSNRVKGLERRGKNYPAHWTPAQVQAEWQIRKTGVREKWASEWEEVRRREELASTELVRLPKPTVVYGHAAQRISQRPSPRQFIAGICPECGDSVVVIRGWWNGSIRHSDCTQKHHRRLGRQQRRARMKGAAIGDPVHLAEIRERDKHRCGICGGKVNGKPFPHPLSATLDHIVPLSQGGAHDPLNVRLAHLRCNTLRGARGGGEQLRMV